MPSPLPPSNGSPSTLPSKSMTTRSPFSAACLAGRRIEALLALGEPLDRLRRSPRRVGSTRQPLDLQPLDLRLGHVGQGLDLDLDHRVLARRRLPRARRCGCIAGRSFCSAISCWTPSWTALFSACCSSCGAVHLADEVGGHLAGAEAGHAHLRRDRLQLLVDAGVDVLGGNGDPVGALQALVQRLDSLHVGFKPSCQRLAGVGLRAARSWCGRRDSNPHIFRYQDLNLARLPVPPRPPGRRQAASIAAAMREGKRLPARRGAEGAQAARRRNRPAAAAAARNRPTPEADGLGAAAARCRKSRIRPRGGRHTSASGRSRGSGSPRFSR